MGYLKRHGSVLMLVWEWQPLEPDLPGGVPTGNWASMRDTGGIKGGENQRWK